MSEPEMCYDFIDFGDYIVKVDHIERIQRCFDKNSKIYYVVYFLNIEDDDKEYKTIILNEDKLDKLKTKFKIEKIMDNCDYEDDFLKKICHNDYVSAREIIYQLDKEKLVSLLEKLKTENNKMENNKIENNTDNFFHSKMKNYFGNYDKEKIMFLGRMVLRYYNKEKINLSDETEHP